MKPIPYVFDIIDNDVLLPTGGHVKDGCNWLLDITGTTIDGLVGLDVVVIGCVATGDAPKKVSIVLVWLFLILALLTVEEDGDWIVKFD